MGVQARLTLVDRPEFETLLRVALQARVCYLSEGSEMANIMESKVITHSF